MAIPNIKNIVMGVIGLVLSLVVTLQMLPTLTYYVGWINATTLAGVPLASVLILIAPYATFFLVLGIVLLAFNMFSGKK
jgi:hypothetical protein